MAVGTFLRAWWEGLSALALPGGWNGGQEAFPGLPRPGTCQKVAKQGKGVVEVGSPFAKDGPEQQDIPGDTLPVERQAPKLPAAPHPPSGQISGSRTEKSPPPKLSAGQFRVFPETMFEVNSSCLRLNWRQTLSRRPLRSHPLGWMASETCVSEFKHNC